MTLHNFSQTFLFSILYNSTRKTLTTLQRRAPENGFDEKTSQTRYETSFKSLKILVRVFMNEYATLKQNS